MKKILIIDDEEDLCQLVKSYFERRKYEVDFSHTLKEGILKISNYYPDIVILDNNLPDGFGLDHIEEIKHIDPNINLIMISALSYLKEDSLDKGANFFLEKPVNFLKINELI